MHILYVLPLLPTYRAIILRFLAHRSLPVASQYYLTMLESVYLQKTWLSLPMSAECHLSWIYNHSNRATYITSQLNALTFCKNRLSNFSLEKDFEAYFLIYALIPPVAEPPNLMPPRSICLLLDTKYSREDTKLRSFVEHTSRENSKIHIFSSGS